jgi:hypothetical protein
MEDKRKKANDNIMDQLRLDLSCNVSSTLKFHYDTSAEVFNTIITNFENVHKDFKDWQLKNKRAIKAAKRDIRDIRDVIRKLIQVIPSDEEVIKHNLEKLSDTISYRAPEIAWKEVQWEINKIFSGAEGVDTGLLWAKTFLSIWMGTI